MFKKITSFIIGFLSIALASSAAQAAALTPSQITAEIQTLLADNANGNIRAIWMRQMLQDLYDSSAVLGNTQTWTAPQTFSVAPIFSSQTGYCYANSASPVTCATTLPIAAVPNAAPQVANNTALSALASTYSGAIVRLGFAAVGDAPPITYTPSGSACSLNAGAGDGGSQVPTSDSKCWIANLPPQPPVTIWGAKGDGTTDDYAAFVKALSATTGGALGVPNPAGGFYKIGTATITIPASTRLVGASKITTQLKHAFNGDMFIMSDASSLENVYLEGDGANFTGGAMVFQNTDGRQVRRDVRAYNFVGPIESFGVNAGSQSFAENINYRRTGGTTGSGIYSVSISPTQQLAAVPKTYVGYQSEGYASFDFGGGNDLFISGSFLGDLNFTLDTRGVSIVNSRWANQASATINGHNNSIVGNDINPLLTIASGADNIIIGPNSYNQMPITDNSGNSRNQITANNIGYTPVITTGGTAFALGNGSVTGSYARTGATTTVTGQLTFGSTTTVGTGGYSFSLPQQRQGADVFIGGQWTGNRGGIIYTGFIQIAGNVTTGSFIRDTTGSITFNSPGVWAAGDTFRWSITYSN